jgi:uncharacterized membrane protein YdjX (TVP38/TMEM64 family)
MTESKLGYSLFFLIGYTAIMIGIGLKFGAWIGFIAWGGILAAACASVLLTKDKPE